MVKDKGSKRDLILDAAYHLFINKGYWDTKIIDIADLAGIGKGTVYEYFESKDAIFFELFQTKVASCYTGLADLLDKKIPCRDKLKEYLDIELDNISKFTFNKSFLMDLMMKSDAFRNPDLIQAIHQLIKNKFNILHGIIDEGVRSKEFRNADPLLASVSVMGAINLYISIGCIPDDSWDLFPSDKAAGWDREDFLDLLLNGLKY